MNVGSVILYHTAGCHLCEVAERLLEQIDGLEYQRLDIATEHELVERYGVRIPVVRMLSEGDVDTLFRDEQELGWPFSAEQLAAFLEQFSQS